MGSSFIIDDLSSSSFINNLFLWKKLFKVLEKAEVGLILFLFVFKLEFERLFNSGVVALIFLMKLLYAFFGFIFTFFFAVNFSNFLV